ncbi:MAG: CDP-diacylglycerol--glycerol-3-phosphate 3-phosphatidyltransferase [Dictyoglomus sp. NZ13-RE01]|nr:MAG: CDP-diacylglycerol--glycerol-3-phosphate 3-phosphatidyltransferase [Dictyoglomus sp. NZ13-RE01]
MGKSHLIPNYLTALRIILTFPIVILLLLGNYELIAGIIFLIAIFTDYLDGKIARAYNQVSNLGKFLDPLADKILVLSILIVLVEKNMISSLIPIIILTREFAVSGLRMVLAQKGIVLSALKEGKVKTALQNLSLIFYLFKIPAKEYILVLALLITIYSGITYFVKNWKYLSE